MLASRGPAVPQTMQVAELRFEGERLRRILEDRNLILEHIATGAPIATVLELLCTTCEAAEPGLLCSVLLLDQSRKRLLTGAAPSLPAFYNEVVHGIAIGPDAGSCGSAAYHEKRVVVED